MYNLSYKLNEKSSPSMENINTMIAAQMSNMSAPLRFSNCLSTNTRKILVNLCPFPRLHFYALSYAPFVSANVKERLGIITTEDMIEELIQSRNMMCKLNNQRRRAICSYLVFRGKMSEGDIETQIKKKLHK